MLQFIALGGALDPKKEKPAIGGSAYALMIDDWTLLVDFGIYHSLQFKESEGGILLVEEEPTEYMDVGSEKWPILPVFDFSKLFEKDDLYLLRASVAHYLPSDELILNAKKLAVVVTHAHVDHSGALPYLKKCFPDAAIMMTRATLDISMWSWKNNLRNARRDKRPPLFLEDDINALKESVRVIEPNERMSFPSFELQFFPAGHILGAVSVLVRIPGTTPRTIFVSGDMSFENQYTVPGAPPLTKAEIGGELDCLILEATNGGKVSQPRRMLEEAFVSDVESCLARGGKFLLGAFSIARAQEIFGILHAYGVTRRWSVYFDGTACDVASIYSRHGALPGNVAEHFIQTDEERNEALTGEKPLVMIAPAGMFNVGRSLQYAVAWAENPAHVIGITSYQDPCAPGYQILNLKPGQHANFGGKNLHFNASVKKYQISSHLDMAEMVKTIERLEPREVFLVHGEEEAMDKVRSAAGASVQKTFLNEPYVL